jgi:hypothetical protein
VSASDRCNSSTTLAGHDRPTGARGGYGGLDAAAERAAAVLGCHATTEYAVPGRRGCVLGRRGATRSRPPPGNRPMGSAEERLAGGRRAALGRPRVRLLAGSARMSGATPSRPTAAPQPNPIAGSRWRMAGGRTSTTRSAQTRMQRQWRKSPPTLRCASLAPQPPITVAVPTLVARWRVVCRRGMAPRQVFCLIAKDPKNFGFWAAKEVEIAVCTASPSLTHPHPIARMPHPYAILPCLMESSAGLPAV